MDWLVESVSQAVGLPLNWTWFLFGAVAMLLVRGLFSRKNHHVAFSMGASEPKTFRTEARKAPVSFSSSSVNISVNGVNSPLSPEVVEQLKALLGSGDKIGAIKLVREQAQLGLAEAKTLVEVLEKSSV